LNLSISILFTCRLLTASLSLIFATTNQVSSGSIVSDYGLFELTL
jgi:hypothetical protein